MGSTASAAQANAKRALASGRGFFFCQTFQGSPYTLKQRSGSSSNGKLRFRVHKCRDYGTLTPKLFGEGGRFGAADRYNPGFYPYRKDKDPLTKTLGATHPMAGCAVIARPLVPLTAPGGRLD